ncbi:tho complex subunit 6 homolog [Plakobranchus ocellatus]|uniref:Tho complex subunit 6 homolog n=1 Tax=Plakobranchus ocellatus TaxID=259542 RepID=A0AAV3YLU8_9GAST|nr:tho complex subunit 6 homolog [Plakobranchus ocellatus]
MISDVLIDLSGNDPIDIGEKEKSSLVGQSATKSKVRGSIPTPGKVSFSMLLCVHPALNGELGLLRPGESKGGEESNGKLPHNAVCQEQSGPYSWFPDA